MADKFLGLEVLNKGLEHFKNNAERALILKAYTAGDSYATVTAAPNVVASAATTATDYTVADQGTNERKITTTLKNTTVLVATTQGVDDLHIAFVDDTNGQVMGVTDETSNQTLTIGNSIDIPSIVFDMKQPT